jgi:protein TonB
MQTGLRFTVTMPLAALATAGLFIGMKALITGEFAPQTKLAAAKFEINPVAEDIIPDARVTKVAELKTIETPPPPPIIERTQAAQPDEPIVTPDGGLHDFNPEKIIFSKFEIQESDRDAAPIIRVAANMPPRAERSGHCKLRFDVTPEGTTYNIQMLSCSSPMFERPTQKAVAKWKYRPKIRNGSPVARSGVETMMSFNLTDERGQIIPE